MFLMQTSNKSAVDSMTKTCKDDDSKGVGGSKEHDDDSRSMKDKLSPNFSFLKQNESHSKKDLSCSSGEISNTNGSSHRTSSTTSPSTKSKTWTDALQRMEAHCPESTAEERERFLIARKGNTKQACHQLKKYLKWHFNNSVPMDDSSNKLKQGRGSNYTSEESSSSVMSSTGSVNSAQGNKQEQEVQNNDNGEDSVVEITKLVYMPDDDKTRSLDGYRIFHIIPAVLDGDERSTKEHVNQVAKYIDSKVSRETMEKFYVVIDARKGADTCPNPPPMQCLPFAKGCCSLLPDLFPERLKVCVVYPVPSMFQWLWHTILRPLLDKDIAEKFQLLSDDKTNWDDPPPSEINNFFHETAIATMEDCRQKIFNSFDKVKK